LERLGVLVHTDRPAPEAGDRTEQTGRGGEHRFSGHVPTWAYLPAELARPYDASVSARSLFAVLDKDIALPELLEQTGFFVFVGAETTPAFAALEKDEKAVKLVFEPDPEVFTRFLQPREARNLARSKTFFFVGDPEAWPASLFALLPPALCESGFPVFLVQEGLAERFPEYLARLIEIIEIFYFRNRIYSIEGQANRRGLPLRNLKRGLLYDQLKHFIENLAAHETAGTMDDLRGRCVGATAYCIAAGPDLDEKIELLKQNRDKAILISVNNALRVLLKHGIEPHFAVINDTSIDAGKAFDGIPRGLSTILVAHSLANAGGGRFQRVYFFGDFMDHLLCKRGNLKLHGSVVTTAFSLALLLGCNPCALVGAQLASPHPFAFSYSRDSRYGNGPQGQETPPLIHRHPQLYPCRAANGKPMYTTLNFRDASLWFLEYIREAASLGIDVVNTTADSLIYGKGVRIDPDFVPPRSVDSATLVRNLPCSPPRMNQDDLLTFLGAEIATWGSVKAEATALAKSLERWERGDEAAQDKLLARASERVAYFDGSTISYLVQRFEDFDNARFHRLFFSSQEKKDRFEGAFYYFSYLRRLARVLLSLLADQRIHWNRLQR
jgi:hypothetical protein